MKATCSAFLRYKERNPFKKIKRSFGNIKRCIHRCRYGYCDHDIWDMDSWFLTVIPTMLTQLKETTHGYPANLEGGEGKWAEILDRMIFLFNEADEDKCSHKNPYEEAYLASFYNDPPTLKEDNALHFSDDPKDKDITEKYLKADKEIWEYRNKCKDEAFEMFSKWFWNLWD